MSKDKSFKNSKDAKRLMEELEASFEKNRLKWLNNNGFNENGDTYIIYGETYSIKNDIKSAGFQYHKDLGWHKAEPTAYEDRLIKVNINEIAEGSAWGDYRFFSNVKLKIKEKIEELVPSPTADPSEWIGVIGKRLSPTPVKLISKKICHSYYGLQNIYTFKTFVNDTYNILVWFTTTTINYNEGDCFVITAKVKDHKLYKGVKQTIITRTSFPIVEE